MRVHNDAIRALIFRAGKRERARRSMCDGYISALDATLYTVLHVLHVIRIIEVLLLIEELHVKALHFKVAPYS